MMKMMRVVLVIPFVSLILLHLYSLVPVTVQVVPTQDGSYVFELHSWVLDYYLDDITQFMLLGSSMILCFVGIIGDASMEKQKEKEQEMSEQQKTVVPDGEC